MDAGLACWCDWTHIVQHRVAFITLCAACGIQTLDLAVIDPLMTLIQALFCLLLLLAVATPVCACALCMCW